MGAAKQAVGEKDATEGKRLILIGELEETGLGISFFHPLLRAHDCSITRYFLQDLPVPVSVVPIGYLYFTFRTLAYRFTFTSAFTSPHIRSHPHLDLLAKYKQAKELKLPTSRRSIASAT